MSFCEIVTRLIIGGIIFSFLLFYGVQIINYVFSMSWIVKKPKLSIVIFIILGTLCIRSLDFFKELKNNSHSNILLNLLMQILMIEIHFVVIILGGAIYDKMKELINLKKENLKEKEFIMQDNEKTYKVTLTEIEDI